MATISKTTFQKLLREEMRAIADEYGLNLDNADNRGLAFEHWLARLIIRAESYSDIDPEDVLLTPPDLGTDLFFEDETNKSMLLVQAKASGKVNEEEVATFFQRHSQYLDRSWVEANGSLSAVDALRDYAERMAAGWTATYWFMTPADDSDRTRDLAARTTEAYSESGAGVRCELFSSTALKEYYQSALSVEESLLDSVTFSIQSSRALLLDGPPYRTLVAVIKANELRNLYQQHKQRLFAMNVRGYLGRKGLNADIAETLVSQPDDFFYLNNGVSAICTSFAKTGAEVTATKFQIINGAQTVSIIGGQTAQPDAYVLFRLTEAESVATEKGINAQIIKANNSQNAVKLSDFRANDPIQVFLEREFRAKRDRGALPKFHYLRRRQVGRAGDGLGVRLEELAKLRYAFLYEPTLVHASPRLLWTREDDEGVYEKAFGVGGAIEAAWSQDVLHEARLGLALLLRVASSAREAGRRNAQLKPLYRLRYHALSLAGLAVRAPSAGQEFDGLADDRAEFDLFFEAFWRPARTALLNVYERAVAEDQSFFAFVRSDDRWEEIKTAFHRERALADL